MDISRLTIIIPCYKPDNRLINLINCLIKKGFTKFILIDDGCSSEYKEIFSQCKSMNSQKVNIYILRHAINLGQGRAYKTAFNFYLNEMRESDIGIIQCDADGQHDVDDIEKCAQILLSNPKKFILGVRDFSLDSVPSRSKWGNRITSFVFKYLCGLNIKDTQSGLKGIPRYFIPALLETSGERFEYASAVLLETKNQNISILEYKINTIYIGNNETSHFRPLIDSWRIYSLILKFSFSSFSAAIIDLIIFSIAIYSLKKLGCGTYSILLSTVISRIVSVYYNYMVNKNIIFKTQKNSKCMAVKYLLLALVQMILSAGIITIVYKAIGISEIVVKILVDTLLFFGSFYIQREWIFGSNK